MIKCYENTPTIFIRSQLEAMSIIKSFRHVLAEDLSSAISGLTVAANNGRQIIFNTSNTTVPPSPIVSRSNWLIAECP